MCTVYFLMSFYFMLYRLYSNPKATNSDGQYCFKNESEIVLFGFIVPNFICYTFSRGVHIQFLLWINYSLPYLFTKGASLSWKAAIILCILLKKTCYNLTACDALFDWCHSWAANVIQPLALYDVISTVGSGNLSGTWKIITSQLFTQLKSLTLQESLRHDSVVRMIGGYYSVHS